MKSLILVLSSVVVFAMTLFFFRGILPGLVNMQNDGALILAFLCVILWLIFVWSYGFFVVKLLKGDIL